MTANQVNYWRNKEVERANKENEKLGRDTLAESGRHNLAQENISWANLAENYRHNVANEGISRRNAASQYRQSTASLWNARTRESELVSLDRYRGSELDIRQRQLSNEERRTDISDRLANETVRSNIAREAETSRHNLIVERETSRHNRSEELEAHRSNRNAWIRTAGDLFIRSLQTIGGRSNE